MLPAVAVVAGVVAAAVAVAALTVALLVVAVATLAVALPAVAVTTPAVPPAALVAAAAGPAAVACGMLVVPATVVAAGAVPAAGGADDPAQAASSGRGLDINGAESNVKEISHKACVIFRIPMRSLSSAATTNLACCHGRRCMRFEHDRLYHSFKLRRFPP